MWWAPLAYGAASFFGQQSANAANVEIAQGNWAQQDKMQQSQQAFNAQQATTAREFAAIEAQKSRDFQESMSSTSWQRATADMRAAGINPMAAFMKGGASTPAGATASAPAATSGAGGGGASASVRNALAAGITSALDAKRLQKDIDQADSQIQLQNASKAAVRADERLKNASAKQVELKSKAVEARADADEAAARADQTIYEHGGRFLEKVAPWLRGMGKLGSSKRKPPKPQKGGWHAIEIGKPYRRPLP